MSAPAPRHVCQKHTEKRSHSFIGLPHTTASAVQNLKARGLVDSGPSYLISPTVGKCVEPRCFLAACDMFSPSSANPVPNVAQVRR